jgi:drug/metabolite transporter (DMT)-like permease
MLKKPQTPFGPGLLQLNGAVFLFGFTGLFGKWLSLPPFVVVFGRVAFASLSMLWLLWLGKQSLRLKNRRDLGALLLLGALLTAHWISFFASIQASNVAICLIALSTAPMFCVLLESVLFEREPLRASNLLVALAVMAGVAVATPSWHVGNAATQGVLWGLFSALTSALITLLSRRLVSDYPPLVVSFYQLTTVVLLLLPFVLWTRPAVSVTDVGLLATLGIVFTGLAQLLFMHSLRGVPARLASLVTAGMEVVYGVLLAALLLHEIPRSRTVLGGILIILATIYAMRQHRADTAVVAPV